MLVYSHTDCLLKDNGFNHPERKERLDSILESIKQIKNIKISFKEAPLADTSVISLVHPKKHIEKIFSNIPKSGLIGVEKEPYADTMLCPNSKKAILRSCGAGIAAADDLMHNNKKQLYGTQVVRYNIKKENGYEMSNDQFWNIEDEKNVDIRRKELGLAPLADYAKLFGIDYIYNLENEHKPFPFRH